MPIPLQYLPCPDLPTFGITDSTQVKVQLAFEWANESAVTSLTFEGPSEHPDFERYAVLHQAERDIDAFYHQQLISKIMENQRFPAFYNRKVGYFLVQTRRTTTRDAFDRLINAEPPVNTEHVSIDLKKVMSIGHTTGAYFGNLKIDKVRTAAVFGDTTVVESEEWEHYSELGELSTLYMRVLDDEGERRTLQFMRDRGILLMKDSGEYQNLDFAATIQSSIEELEN